VQHHPRAGRSPNGDAGINEKYAAFVHEGASKMEGRPNLKDGHPEQPQAAGKSNRGNIEARL